MPVESILDWDIRVLVSEVYAAEGLECRMGMTAVLEMTKDSIGAGVQVYLLQIMELLLKNHEELKRNNTSTDYW